MKVEIVHRLEGLRYKKLGQMANVKTISLTELLLHRVVNMWNSLSSL